MHETTVHLYDALASQGREGEWSIAPVLAWDGVDEVVSLFYPRQVRLGRIQPLARAVRLVATDVDARPVLLGEGEPTVELTGPAERLLLMLWKRAEVADPGARSLLTTAVTP